MGQSSLPVLNKVGLSMRWDSSYDSSVNFKKYVLLDIFIKKFFDFIFDDKILLIFYNNFFFKKLKNSTMLNIFKIKKKKIPVYASKIWLLRHQKWVVVSVYLYIPKIFLKKSLKIKKIKLNTHNSFFSFLLDSQKYNFLYKYNI